ncbi:O-acetyl-ADP-ribose deacetylase [Mycobacterium sp. ENV421]|uniref:O-acetyl-ADP-ribose deacetylase n=1 Tax=Mycobacterium sp. ENV421 TaxID=1213407 RepID=UPI000C9C5E99|nr:O-acetyl-ADP-ribose deacetylase [Mycobacterium sp. ENV421]
MRVITSVLGDITKQDVDAIVNAANTAMRGGGGVDGAIHRAGGPVILRDCIERFPNGLPTGDAGWTRAGNLPARWVIHTVGPNYGAGQRDRSLLKSCYRRALQVADELGARSVAFPLISTGAYGWPRHEAIATAIQSVADADTDVTEVRFVAFDSTTHEAVRNHLAISTPTRILQGVRTLHERGYDRIRILPGMSPSGMYWRVTITTVDNMDPGCGEYVRDYEAAVTYTSGGLNEFAGSEVTVTTSAETVADIILNALPKVMPTADDPAYVAWYAGLVHLVELTGKLPVAYAEYFDATEGWELGWGSNIRYPRPPKTRKDTR